MSRRPRLSSSDGGATDRTRLSVALVLVGGTSGARPCWGGEAGDCERMRALSVAIPIGWEGPIGTCAGESARTGISPITVSGGSMVSPAIANGDDAGICTGSSWGAPFKACEIITASAAACS